MHVIPATCLLLLSAHSTLAAPGPPDLSFTDIAFHSITLSHLSPLLTYSPASAWNITHASAITREPGASVSIDWLGQLAVWGGARGAEIDVSDGGKAPTAVSGSARARSILHSSVRTIGGGSGAEDHSAGIEGEADEDGAWYRFDSGQGPPLTRRSWTARVLPRDDKSKDEDQGGGIDGTHIRIDRVHMDTALPADSNHAAENLTNAHAEPVVLPASHPHRHKRGQTFSHPPSTLNLFFQHTTSWSSFLLPSSYRSDRATTVPTPGGPSNTSLSADTWPSPYLVCTRQPSEPLKFEVPRGTSIVQVYGAVGTQHGAVQITWTARSHGDGEADGDGSGDTSSRQGPVDPMRQGGRIVVDTHRPVNATAQLIAVIWLDPRVRYNSISIALMPPTVGQGTQLGKLDAQQSRIAPSWSEHDHQTRIGRGGGGKLACLQGVAFKTYISNPDDVSGDWLEEWNKRNAPEKTIWERVKEKLGVKTVAAILFAGYLSGKIIPLFLCYKLWQRRRYARRMQAAQALEAGGSPPLGSDDAEQEQVAARPEYGSVDQAGTGLETSEGAVRVGEGGGHDRTVSPPALASASRRVDEREPLLGSRHS